MPDSFTSPHVLVLEGLLLHDVAPVAGGVAHREEDEPVQPLGLLQGGGAPGAPVDLAKRSGEI